MKKSLLNLLISSLIVFISSCTKKDKTGLLVPKDAALVVHVSSSSLSSKLKWEDIKATSWFQKMYSRHHESDSLAEKLMNDPASSGIDTKSDFVYFMQMRKTGAHLVIDGKLNNTTAFENYLKKIMPKGEIKKDGEFSSFAANEESETGSNKNAAIVWNKEWFAFIIDIPGMNRRNPFANDRSKFSKPDSSEDYMPDHNFNSDSLKKIGKEILSLSDTKTLGTDKRFAGLVKEEGDIHFWVNVEKLYSLGTMGMYMSMMKMNSLLKGNISTATINFDNGKITAKGKQYYGDEMNRLIKKYKPQPVNASLVNRLPSDNIMAVLALNYSPEGLNEMLKMIGVDGVLNLLLAKQNFSIEDFIKANKGEMLLALTNVENKMINDTMMGANEEPMIFPRRKTEVKFVLANAINDRGAFDRLMSLVKGDKDELEGPLKNFTYQVKDNWFVFGDPDNVNTFLAGNNNHLSFADRISGHPLGCYINIQNILKRVAETEKSENSIAALNTSMNMWQDIVITGGDYKDGGVYYNAEINLIDKKTNSLQQLNKYIDQLAGIFSDHLVFDGNKMEDIRIDTLQTAPKAKPQ